ncbi:unnamed protein product [Staurois parvus]|uniref:Uncharacterized protein n=1 Tax=Staurois parvus TaxID=386267 RepID=A0ABN9BHA1_9NEOB|nr:unnamed protein product [Staurois parvus]
MTPKGRGMMGLVVSQQLGFDTPELATAHRISGVSNWRPSSCCETTSPIKPLPLGVILVTVNLAMPHRTCSLATARGPPV